MLKRSSKPDPTVMAYHIVQATTGQTEAPPSPPVASKNPAAVELGRRGGLKGGKARAAALSKAERSAIAKKAAKARWKAKRKPKDAR